VELRGKPGEGWSSATAQFGGLRPGHRTDEVRFEVPSGAELWIDDVLLYEP
jgi:hypothetical protein